MKHVDLMNQLQSTVLHWWANPYTEGIMKQTLVHSPMLLCRSYPDVAYLFLSQPHKRLVRGINVLLHNKHPGDNPYIVIFGFCCGTYVIDRTYGGDVPVNEKYG